MDKIRFARMHKVCFRAYFVFALLDLIIKLVLGSNVNAVILSLVYLGIIVLLALAAYCACRLFDKSTNASSESESKVDSSVVSDRHSQRALSVEDRGRTNTAELNDGYSQRTLSASRGLILSNITVALFSLYFAIHTLSSIVVGDTLIFLYTIRLQYVVVYWVMGFVAILQFVLSVVFLDISSSHQTIQDIKYILPRPWCIKIMLLSALWMSVFFLLVAFLGYQGFYITIYSMYVALVVILPLWMYLLVRRSKNYAKSVAVNMALLINCAMVLIPLSLLGTANFWLLPFPFLVLTTMNGLPIILLYLKRAVRRRRYIRLDKNVASHKVILVKPIVAMFLLVAVALIFWIVVTILKGWRVPFEPYILMDIVSMVAVVAVYSIAFGCYCLRYTRIFNNAKAAMRYVPYTLIIVSITNLVILVNWWIEEYQVVLPQYAWMHYMPYAVVLCASIVAAIVYHVYRALLKSSIAKTIFQ